MQPETLPIIIYCISFVLSAPVLLQFEWERKSKKEREDQGLTLRDLCVAMFFSLMPVINTMLVCVSLNVYWEWIANKLQNVSIYKARKTYTEDEVKTLLESINELRLKPESDRDTLKDDTNKTLHVRPANIIKH